MHLAKLIKVLKSFDTPRFARLQKYVSSPYFAVYQPSVSLLQYLAPLHPQFPAQKINVKVIGAINENLSSDAKQSVAGTRLMQAISGFLAQEEWQKKKGEVKRYELEGFKELRLMEEFDKGYEKEMGRLAKSGGHEMETFADRHFLTEIFHNGFNARLNRTQNNSIMPVVKTLDEYYAIKKLRYLCEALNRQQTMGIEVTYHDLHFPTLLRILEPYTNPQHPYVYLFVNVFRMLIAKSLEESKIHYRIIQEFAIQHPAPLSAAMIESSTYANTACLRWANAADSEAGKEYLWWVEWRRKNNLLLENGQLMPITFRNIITIAVNIKKDPSWIQNTISTYAPYLPSEHAEASVAFAQGLYHYSLKKYKEAIRFFLLAQAGEEVIFSCIIRRWQWMCLYEYDANDTDALRNHLASFEKFLLRNKKQLHHVMTPFTLFISYAMKLVKATTSHLAASDIRQLEAEIYFPGKPWLLEGFAAKTNTRSKRKAMALDTAIPV